MSRLTGFLRQGGAPTCILGVMPQGSLWTLGYRPALDGVRGIAILLVLASHVAIPGLAAAGPVGVAVFFTLSGFLITGLLLSEQERTDRISLPRFYERRARRLLPALFASSAAVAAATIWLGPWWFNWGQMPPALFYYANWVKVDPSGNLAALSGTWSLAIEEQFYLVWPALLVVLVRQGRRVVMLAASLGAAVSLLARTVAISQGASADRVYYGSDMVAFALLAGAAMVSWRLGRPPGRMRPTGVAISILLILWASTWPAGVARYLALPVVALGTVVLLHSCTGEGGLGALKGRVLVWFGQRSYGLYLWHCPIAWALREHSNWSWPALVAAVVPASLLLAEISFRWIERPWLARRDLASHHKRGVSPNAVVEPPREEFLAQRTADLTGRQSPL